MPAHWASRGAVSRGIAPAQTYRSRASSCACSATCVGGTGERALNGLSMVEVREDIVVGLENAPESFIGLLLGKNFGKLVIQLAREQASRRSG